MESAERLEPLNLSGGTSSKTSQTMAVDRYISAKNGVSCRMQQEKVGLSREEHRAGVRGKPTSKTRSSRLVVGQ